LEKLSTVSYITNFWAATEVSTANLHRKEIQAAILSNINNAHFDQVVVLLDGITEHANCTHFFDEMYLLDRTHNLHKTVDPKTPATGFRAKIRPKSTHTPIESSRCGLFIDGITTLMF
jgi:hypothetical protein